MSAFTVTPVGVLVGLGIAAVVAAVFFAWLIVSSSPYRCKCPTYPLMSQDGCSVIYKIRHRLDCPIPDFTDKEIAEQLHIYRREI